MIPNRLFSLVLCLAACGSGKDTNTVDECDTGNPITGADCPTIDTESPTDDTSTTHVAGTCQDGLSFGDPVDPEGQFEVGDFIVQIDSSGDLIAMHSDDLGHNVFESGPAPWFSVGGVDLHAEEHQGSFDIEINQTFMCNSPRLEEVNSANGVIQISGDFSDADGRCDNATFTLEICEAGEGRLAFNLRPESDSTLNYSSIKVHAEPDEHIFGMGEQFPHNDLNLNGRQIDVLSEEGGVGRGHPIISTVVNLASPGSGGSEGTTYYAAPHYLTSQLHSIFVKETSYAQFDFTEDDYTEVRLFNEDISWEALYGTSPLELIERFTEYAGRMPAPPDWTQNGAILALARPLADGLVLVDKLNEAGAEISGVWNQTWSGINETFIGEQVLWNWVLDEDEHPIWDDWVETLASENIRPLCYINSMFLDVSDRDPAPSRHLFEEGQNGGYFVKDENGDTLMIPVTAFDVALLDFTNEAARTWMKDVLIDELVENASCAGWMVDFAEALPFEAILHDGSDAADYHNRYPVEWMRLNREAIEEAGLLGEILTFNRSGHTQSPSYSLMFWEGDQLTTWDNYDGMTSALRGLISGGFSGLALNHSDTGGYTSLSIYGLGYVRQGEMLKRWAEMSAFTSLLRTHEGNQPTANAQVYDDDQLEHFSWASRVFAGLAEYRSTLFEEAEAYGWPVARHLWLQYPNDVIALSVDDQFMLGEGFLVAPILEGCGGIFSCDSKRDVYLPQANWTNLWTGETFRGPTTFEVDSPLGQPPVYYDSDNTRAVDAVQELRSRGVGVH